MAFSAGIFLCISLGDLLPEVHFHSHDRLQLSGMLLLGVLLALLIEVSHSHEQPQPEEAEVVQVSSVKDSSALLSEVQRH